MCLSNGCNYDDISKNILALNIFKNTPILGICFGFQIICDIYGAKIKKLKTPNNNIQNLNIPYNNLSLLKNNTNLKLFFSHNDYISQPPNNFKYIRHPNTKYIIGIENISMKIFGFQFHPEGTEDGKQIIIEFIKICTTI